MTNPSQKIIVLFVIKTTIPLIGVNLCLTTIKQAKFDLLSSAS